MEKNNIIKDLRYEIRYEISRNKKFNLTDTY